MILSTLATCCQTAVLPWLFTFSLGSLEETLPWEDSSAAAPWNPSYFPASVEGVTDCRDSSLEIVPKILVILGFTYIIIALVLKNGFDYLIHLAYYTGAIPFFLLVLLISKSSTLTGSREGISYLMTLQWDKFWNFKLWETALS
mmetsp:Transcript_32836/g.50162  ORF Transcript_32836/g.50162 Transcript_32836/m.50162 type:complete len:144 (+) Transcript_32836:434-865(+)